MERNPPRSPIRSFRDLDVYQRGREALIVVHDVVKSFPECERYGLADQMRRASKSVTTTIAEGYAKKASATEFKRYLRMSLGSANEMEAHVETALDLGYVSAQTGAELSDRYQTIGKQLTRLIQAWRTFEAPPSSIVELPASVQKSRAHRTSKERRD